jgi:predicted NBD/HSP70 family sugar kinase
MMIQTAPKVKPELDPEFIPAVLWNRSYLKAVAASGKAQKVVIALNRPNGTVSTFGTEIFLHEGEYKALNVKYVERLIKFLLWMKGGYRVTIAGCAALADDVRAVYAAKGVRAFDNEIMGERIYGKPFEVAACALAAAPQSHEIQVQLGGHTDGCRIGFDLGGSDRKCAAVKDGEVVFTEEVTWDPYFQKDPEYHRLGILDSLRRAAEKLPRVDAIGGSAAGVYVNNEVRVASLFRGVAPEEFETTVRPIFKQIQKAWGGIPFDVVNDGEVTALAGAMSLNDNAVLGISMGTSLAAGYVTPEGNITSWLNELAFVPVDYRANGPVDEWSGDAGCGVQFFSQQGVARLALLANLEFPADTPFAQQLVEVQRLMSEGDDRARKIYETIGVCFGYTIAHFATLYDFRNLLILGRVTSGTGGQIIIEKAEEVLTAEFPALAAKVKISTPDERMKRHGQAVAAASLPMIGE